MVVLVIMLALQAQGRVHNFGHKRLVGMPRPEVMEQVLSLFISMKLFNIFLTVLY